METYSYKLYLPLYKEPSAHFKRFMNSIKDSDGPVKYLSQWANSKLTFIPSVVVNEGEAPLSRASLSSEALMKPTAKAVNVTEMSKFCSMFNMLSAIQSSNIKSVKSNKCHMHLDLTEMPEEYPDSLYVLLVSFETKDLAISIGVDNFFKLLG